MIVYVLFGEVDYEGSETLGIFSTLEKANAALAEVNLSKVSDEEGQFGWYDSFRILPYEMDEIVKETV